MGGQNASHAGHANPATPRPSGRHIVPPTRLRSDTPSTGVRRGRTPCNTEHHQTLVSLLTRSGDQHRCGSPTSPRQTGVAQNRRHGNRIGVGAAKWMGGRLCC
eukprot:354346-Chlamydomonas_euryale.AAC.2